MQHKCTTVMYPRVQDIIYPGLWLKHLLREFARKNQVVIAVEFVRSYG